MRQIALYDTTLRDGMQAEGVSFSLQDKLLIIHGMMDDNVLFQDSVRLIQKLIDAGKDFDVMVYPKDVHGFHRDETQIDFYRRIAEYFQNHLGRAK